MGLFNKRKESVELSPVLTSQDDPVNYNSVLDYLVGLSKCDYEKLLKVTDIYRAANKSAARVLGIRDESTTALKEYKPTGEEIDNALDASLNNDIAFIDDAKQAAEKPVKEQAQGKSNRIDVN